jgi:hypothetical protein
MPTATPVVKSAMPVVKSATPVVKSATPVVKSARAADQDSSDSSQSHPLFAADCLEINSSTISSVGHNQYNVTVKSLTINNFGA